MWPICRFPGQAQQPGDSRYLRFFYGNLLLLVADDFHKKNVGSGDYMYSGNANCDCFCWAIFRLVVGGFAAKETGNRERGKRPKKMVPTTYDMIWLYCPQPSVYVVS